MSEHIEDPRCPACGKPCWYAPNAKEDSSKYACTDIECVNAHGIVYPGLLYKPITDEELNRALEAGWTWNIPNQGETK